MRLYTVTSIHDGTDVAIVDATDEDIESDEGWAMSYADALALAKKTAAEWKCRWFDMSTPDNSERVAESDGGYDG